MSHSLRHQTLNEQLKRLDDVRSQTDELLFQMIPKQVADRLRYEMGGTLFGSLALAHS